MKKYLLNVVFLLLLCVPLSGQVPDGIHYQAVIREGGVLYSNSPLTLELTILENGSAVYTETHNLQSNDYGHIETVIGTGTIVFGNFAAIDWANANHSLDVRIDVGNGWESMGQSPLVSVPFATYSSLAAAPEFGLNALTDVNTASPPGGSLLRWSGLQWEPGFEQDGDPSNEIQTLSINGNTLILSKGGGSVSLSAGTVYQGGTGISIAGSVITNTGDTDPNDDITINSVAGGDLAGTFPNPQVVSLRGNPVSSASPQTDQILRWNGSSWAPATVQTSSPWITNGPLIHYSGGKALVGRSTTINANEAFGVRANTTSGGEGGMYMESSDPGGIPFYGYANNGSESARTYYDPSSTAWRVNIGNSDKISVNANGNLGVGIANPAAKLSVDGEIRMTAGPFTRGQMFTTPNTAAVMDLKGANGSSNVQISHNPNNESYGYVWVGNQQSTIKAGLLVNGMGQGVVFGDQKNFRMPYPGRPGKEIWYCSLEGAEAAAYLRGTAELVNGRATISFPDHWREVAAEKGMTVILTPLSADSKGLAVIEKGLDQIIVAELMQGKGNYDFDWEVKAVRKGYEDYRVVRDASEVEPPVYRK